MPIHSTTSAGAGSVLAISEVISPSFDVSNLLVNPSFEIDLSGYNPLTSTAITQDPGGFARFGSQSMRVDCDGYNVGEGFRSPSCWVNAGMCSVSLHFRGDEGDHCTVRCIRDYDGAVLATCPHDFHDTWDRCIVDNIPCGNHNIHFEVRCDDRRRHTFWCDGCQIENDRHHDYCDGDQDECYWTGDRHKSCSYRISETASSCRGTHIHGGRVAFQAYFVIQARLQPLSGTGRVPNAGVELFQIEAVFDDFGIWPLTEDQFPAISYPDPAMTYSWCNNVGPSGTSTYTRIGSMFVPPLDYPVSGGQQAWNRAAFGAVGFNFQGVAAANWQDVSCVQLEMPNINSGTGSQAAGNGSNICSWSYPSSFQPPRQLQTIVKPTQLNYCTNPNFSGSPPSYTGATTNWHVLGNATLSVAQYGVTPNAPVSGPNIGTFASIEYNTGSYAMQVVNNSSTQGTNGASMTINNLIVGDPFVASAYINPGPNVGDIFLAWVEGGNYGDVLQLGGTGYGNSNIGYGNGPYGGIAIPSTQLTPGLWTRIYFFFTATADIMTLALYAAPTTAPAPYTASLGSEGRVNAQSGGNAQPAITEYGKGTMTALATIPSVYFFVDAVMVQNGEDLQPYFDGSFGEDALWETNGTPGLTRSYYYPQLIAKRHIVTEVLQQHVPFGISYATPVYSVPPSQ